MKKIGLILYMLAWVTPCIATSTHRPTITLVFIVDQLAYYEVEKVKPYLTGGIKFLLDNGFYYQNAHFDYAVPETATGHSTISTGTRPKDHGITGNSWLNKKGKKIDSDDDSADRAAVFSPTGLYDYGKSSKHLMVDSLSDQFMLAQRPNKKHVAIALSHKSRAAIALASKMGKPFWFDVTTGCFTSSKAYVDALPRWVESFNAQSNVSHINKVMWNLVYPKDNPAYSFMNTTNYTYSGSWGFKKITESLAGREIELNNETSTEDIDAKGLYELYAKTPTGSQLLINCAKTCIDEYIDNQHIDHMLLWVSCSSLDKIGHPFGPSSLEAIDMLYHIDLQCKDLIDYVNNKVGANNALIVLTSDHGAQAIPELVHDAGYTPARRIFANDLIQEMNDLVLTKYHIATFVTNFQDNQFYFDKRKFKSLSKKTAQMVIHDLKKLLRKHDGIKDVWSIQDLHKTDCTVESHDIKAYYKNQLFKDRNGDLFCHTYPYCLLADYHYGTSHISPYNYDTHVPLIVYQQQRVEHKKIIEPVWMEQLAATLSYLMHIQKPSACLFPVLPGIN